MSTYRRGLLATTIIAGLALFGSATVAIAQTSGGEGTNIAATPANPNSAGATKTGSPAAARSKAAAKTASPARRQSPYRRTRETEKAHEYYPAAWGVERLQTALTSSGNLVRFTFRVLDPKRAKPFADHAATPYLYAPRTHAVLQVPTMDKIGQLRQLANLESNKDYWMVFSNKGNLVRAGDRVNVIIGPFHAEGLLVE
jgi:hypothetical protein